MDDITVYIGEKIRNYRKMKRMTLQELADSIHKSRATVCKYETGEITLDVQTLYDISQVLDVGMNQIMDYHPENEYVSTVSTEYAGESPFFRAGKLYFYYYDGSHDHLKEGVISVHRKERREDGSYEASLSIKYTMPNGKSCDVYYSGNVLYSDMLIRFSFINQFNKLEQDLLYIFNPLELRDYTEGLLCGILSSDLVPCAFKCLVTLSPVSDLQELQKHLVLTQENLRRWKKINMFTVTNNV